MGGTEFVEEVEFEDLFMFTKTSNSEDSAINVTKTYVDIVRDKKNVELRLSKIKYKM